MKGSSIYIVTNYDDDGMDRMFRSLHLFTPYRSDVSITHYSSSSYTAVGDDGDDSLTSMDIQAVNNRFPEISEVNKNQSISPNTLHKNLIGIAQQQLVNSNNHNYNEKVNRCKHDNVYSTRTEKKKTTFAPFTIKFQQRSPKSEFQLEKELFLF